MFHVCTSAKHTITLNVLIIYYFLVSIHNCLYTDISDEQVCLLDTFSLKIFTPDYLAFLCTF